MSSLRFSPSNSASFVSYHILQKGILRYRLDIQSSSGESTRTVIRLSSFHYNGNGLQKKTEFWLQDSLLPHYLLQSVFAKEWKLALFLSPNSTIPSQSKLEDALQKLFHKKLQLSQKPLENEIPLKDVILLKTDNQEKLFF